MEKNEWNDLEENEKQGDALHLVYGVWRARYSDENSFL